MSNSDNWLIHEHSLYEDLLTQCQEAVSIEDWETAGSAIHELITHLKRHLTLEEEVLYPAYESAPHAPQGPTEALRAEHEDIVRLIRDILPLLRARESDQVLESLALLEVHMIKHHEREEDIFLPMASHILNTSRDELLKNIAEFDVSKIKRKWDI